MCCVYSFFLKKATVCSENMEKHDIYIYIYIILNKQSMLSKAVHKFVIVNYETVTIR